MQQNHAILQNSSEKCSSPTFDVPTQKIFYCQTKKFMQIILLTKYVHKLIRITLHDRIFNREFPGQ